MRRRFKIQQPWYGYRPDRPDFRDYYFKPTFTHETLPSVVDLRSKCPPVMNQGELGACTAHGITGALRYDLIKQGLADIPLARLQLYYDERAAEGTIKSDSGAEIRDGIKCAAKFGVAPESLWPYDISKFKKKPPATVYKAAKSERALKYERVDVDVHAIKSALAQGFPVVIGISVYESFEGDDVAKTGVVPMPNANEELLGGHCLYCVGYGSKPGYFTVRNSWGEDWGDKGDCYIPEAYLGNSDLGEDYWTVTAFGK